MRAKGRFAGRLAALVLVTISLPVAFAQDPGEIRPAPPAAAAALPLDLAWDQVDGNAIPLDPRWGGQAAGTKAPDPRQACPALQSGSPRECTAQAVTYDSARACGERAHVNWMPATFRGGVRWATSSTDEDVTVRLTTAGPCASTAANGAANTVEAEFDANETLDLFTTAWWSTFRDKLLTDVDRATGQVEGREAVVTGLFGLDCQNGCRAEAHPVWAMALHVADKAGDDTWALFARNWGGQGWCGDMQHTLQPIGGRALTVTLPWRPGASGVALLPSTVFHANRETVKVEIAVAAGKAVEVRFLLPAPDALPLVEGELHLAWTAGTAAPRPVAASAHPATPARLELGRQIGALPREQAMALRAEMTLVRQHRRERLLAAVGRTTFEVAVPAPVEVTAPSGPLAWQPGGPLATARAVADPARAKENGEFASLLKDYGVLK